jgi:hypothetical protein
MIVLSVMILLGPLSILQCQAVVFQNNLVKYLVRICFIFLSINRRGDGVRSA